MRISAGVLALLVLLFQMPAFAAEMRESTVEIKKSAADTKISDGESKTSGMETKASGTETKTSDMETKASGTETKTSTEKSRNFTLLPEHIPVQQYEGGRYQVDVYGSFTQLKDGEGELSVVEDNRLLLKRGSMIPVSTEMDYLDGKVDQVVVDSITGGNNDSQYLSVLEENRRVEDYYEQLKWPEELSNAGIQEISSNLNTNDTVLMVRYTDNTVAAFNYVTGTMLFKDESEKKQLSFGEYVNNWMTEKWNNLFGPNTVDYEDILFLKGQLEKMPLDTELNGNLSGNGQNLSSGEQVYNKDANGLTGSKNVGWGSAQGSNTPGTGASEQGKGAGYGKTGIQGTQSESGAAAPNGVPALSGQGQTGAAGPKGPESQSGTQNAAASSNKSNQAPQGSLFGNGNRIPSSTDQNGAPSNVDQNRIPSDVDEIGIPSDADQMRPDSQALDRHMLESAIKSGQDLNKLVEEGILTDTFVNSMLSDGNYEGVEDPSVENAFPGDNSVKDSLEESLNAVWASQEAWSEEGIGFEDDEGNGIYKDSDEEDNQEFGQESNGKSTQESNQEFNQELIQKLNQEADDQEGGSSGQQESILTAAGESEVPSETGESEDSPNSESKDAESEDGEGQDDENSKSDEDSTEGGPYGDGQDKGDGTGDGNGDRTGERTKEQTDGTDSSLTEANLDSFLTVYNPETGKYELYDTQEYLSQGGTKGNIVSISQKLENMNGGRSLGNRGIFRNAPEWLGYMAVVMAIMLAALFFLKRAIDKKLQI